MDLNTLTFQRCIELLNSPEELRNAIEANRGNSDLDTKVLGFIAFYDELNGDCHQLKQQLSYTKAQIMKPIENAHKLPFSKPFMRVAAILVPLIIGSLLTMYVLSTDNNQLTNVYNDPGIPTFMGNENQHRLETIMFHYRKGDYAQTLNDIESAQLKSATNDTLSYYAAVSHFALKNNTKALQLFMQLSRRPNTYAIKSLYYLGRIYAETGRNKTALNYFRKVAELNDESVSFFAKQHVKELKKEQ